MAVGRHFTRGDFLDCRVDGVEPVFGFVCAGHCVSLLSLFIEFDVGGEGLY